MKINGNSDGGGGSLTPQQEALINQVPNKVDQVRLVTDGSVIRHEGALQALTFNQIYELVMDNSKYVYIVMDNNIRFRPSAYDGDAIWFDSSFIEEGKPNILRCIINSSNVVSIDQIVVASEDYVQDYVDEHGGGGGLTPEQQEALEPMFNTNGGVLKTTEYKEGEYINGFRKDLRDISEISSNEETVPDAFWFKYEEYGKIGMFDPVTLEVKDYMFYYDDFYSKFFWKDNSGRLYFGSYEIKLDTLSISQKVTGGFLNSYNRVLSIFRFGDEILNIYGSVIYIFNEETQRFEGCVLDTSEGEAYTDELMKYEGDIVSFSESLKLVKVEDKYYKWESWEAPFNLITEDGRDVEEKHIHYVNGIGYFFVADRNPNYVYKLQGTEWVKFKESSIYSYAESSIGKFLVLKNYDYTFSLIPCDDAKLTTWSDISSEYVTLNTDQQIKGQKTFSDPATFSQASFSQASFSQATFSQASFSQASFSQASFSQASIETINSVKSFNHYGNEDLKIGLDNNSLNVEGKSINLNGVELPTKNDIFINLKTKVGNRFVKLSNEFYYSYQLGKLGGDIFGIWGGTTARKWNGTGWEFIELPFEFDQPSYSCKVTTSHSVYIDDNQHTWEYADGQFTLINDETSPVPAENIYPLGDKLICGGSNYYFDFNTNSWVETTNTFNHYTPEYVKVIGGITYYNNYYTLYKINDDGTSKQLGNHKTMNTPENYFEYNGDIYFVCNDGVYKFVKEKNEFIKTDFYFNSDDNLYFEYNGELHLCGPEVGGTGLVQVTEFVKPEVPAGDGNYVLRATRVGDKITYSWVSE